MSKLHILIGCAILVVRVNFGSAPMAHTAQNAPRFQGLEIRMGNRVNLGWYQIDETLDSEGSFDLAIRDRRTGELVAVKIDNIEDYNSLIEFLESNRQVGVLTQLKANAA